MKTYNTEVISVGTELLLGHVVNTDASDVSRALSEIGINVLYHTVVGDNPVRLENCIEIAASRADIIITTGGLGPTCDDLTKQILCKAFGLELRLNEEEYRCIYEFMTARHGYTENNTQQAMLPVGCTVFHNSCGTAPGCAFEKNGKIVIMLPGPPKECRAMLKESVVPYLRKLGSEVIVSHSVKVFGICESGIDDMFAEEMNAMTNPTMAPYAKEADCFLKITAKAETSEEAEKMCAPVMERVISRLGDHVYGVDVENLEEVAASLLKEKKKTLALAEGFTGGFLADRFTSVCDDLSVLRADFIMPYAGTSEEVAGQMAVNILQSSGADVAIAVGGADEGRFFIALAADNETFIRPVQVGMPRPLDFRRRSAANYAFDLLRRYLSGLKMI